MLVENIFHQNRKDIAMLTNNNPTKTNDSVFSEAPASWNTRYLDPSGFECQITLRGENGSELLEKATHALDYLLQNGCTPYTNSKGNGYQPKVGFEAQAESPSNGNNGNGHSFCSIHQCSMKRWEKNGRVWYSHKVDGEWCTGRVKNK